MSYVRNNLLSDEKIIVETELHYIIFAQTTCWLLLTLIFALIRSYHAASLLFFILAVIAGARAMIAYLQSEFAVTNMRVLIKSGLINVRYLEIMLRNVASVQVDQSLLGRLCGYGSVKICDNGQVCSLFRYIDNPFEFRKALQKEIDARYPAPQTTPPKQPSVEASNNESSTEPTQSEPSA